MKPGRILFTDVSCLPKLLTVFLLLLSPHVNAQQVAVKTNLLNWATTTFNVGMEAAITRKNTVQLFYGLNPWKFEGEKKIRHWVLQPEFRFWTCESFNGWFYGIHFMGGEFNVGEVKLPLGIFPELEHSRYEGWFAGGGLTGGYQWVLSRHWNIEASVGIGYNCIDYDKFRCTYCGELLKSGKKHYFGPTKAAISILYLF